jgi:alkylation response protein AidB-like acyl-CoA dehydrogenase
VPFLSTTGTAILLDQVGTEAQCERWLEPLLKGNASGAFGLVVGETAPFVVDAARADVVILIQDGTAGLFEPIDLRIDPVDALDLTRPFARVTARGAGEPMSGGDVEGGLGLIRVALAAESVGSSSRALSIAVDYASSRHQFGRPIGVNQAVSHRCAQMLFDTECARAATLFAAYCVDHDPLSAPLAVASAGACALEAGWQVPASAIQVHGGIGFTWEQGLHLRVRRGRMNAELLGSVRSNLEMIAEIISRA